MKKIQCPEIEPGENVHNHFCWCCNGKQHIPFAVALKYRLRGLLVLTYDGRGNASDSEMHDRIRSYISYFKQKHGYTGSISFQSIECGEPIATLNTCIETLIFKD